MNAGENDLVPVELAGTWQPLRGQWTDNPAQKEFTCIGYLVEDDGNQDALCVSSVRISDGALAAQIMVEEQAPERTNAHLVFRYRDPQRYLFAGIGGWKKKFVIAWKVPGLGLLQQPGWETLDQDGSAEDIKLGHWYDLSVDFAARDIRLELGGACVLSYTIPDEHFADPDGNIGLRGFGRSEVHFRNVQAFRRVSASDIGGRLQSVGFSFIKDMRLRAVAERDLAEVSGLDAQAAPKASIMLLGSIAEALLLDYLQTNETMARQAKGAQKGTPKKWNLETMLEVAKELKAIEGPAYVSGQVLRGYRNLIHPSNTRAQSLEPRASQAVAATDFLLALVHDLA
jgi:hypothetical protein